MPRYSVETIHLKTGKPYLKYAISEKDLSERFPDAYRALMEDSSCVGVLDKRKKLSGVGVKITDRERWVELND